jgi:hypothetical protein
MEATYITQKYLTTNLLGRNITDQQIQQIPSAYSPKPYLKR